MGYIKTFRCLICKFGGTRQKVRKHIKEFHHIKGRQKMADGSWGASGISANCEGYYV
jgi:hypothetical protein